MDNLIVLGTGRSGTSMVTGIFRNSGFYCGDNHIAARPSNPTGFNEDSVVNRVNDEVIRRMWAVALPRKLGLPRPRIHDTPSGLWLATPAVRLFRPIHAASIEAMRQRFARQPFCFKDPRFSITLPFWRKHLPRETKFVVTFRDPTRTAASVLREAHHGFHDPPLPVDLEWCLKHWRRIYDWILNDSRRQRHRWHFVHFDDVLSGRALPDLEAFVGTRLDDSHLDRQISRHGASQDIPDICRSVWSRLMTQSSSDCTSTAVREAAEAA